MKSYTRRLVALLTCALVAPAFAQVTIPQEYDKTIKSAEVVGALGNDLFGDQTSFYTGSTTFSITDVSLPGNSTLPVAIGRRFEVRSRDSLERSQLLTRDGMFQDWDLDIPHLHGVFAMDDGWLVDSTGDKTKRCSQNGLEPPVTVGSFQGLWLPTEFWHGYHMYVPGVGDQELLVPNAGTPQPTDGRSYPWVTKDHWRFSCVPLENGLAGEGFLAVDPNGTRYEFDWMADKFAPPIVKNKGSFETLTTGSPGGTTTVVAMAPDQDKTALNRLEIWILPTKITDRFGNYVTYTYDAARPWRLNSVVASDGRQLALTYNTNGHIDSVSDGTRTWRYTYNNGLTTVGLPDGSQWVVDFANIRNAFTTPRTDDEVRLCDNRTSSTTQNVYVATIKHPSGALGVFQFQSKLHGRSYVPKQCIKPDPLGFADYAYQPYLFDTMGLIQKQISGPGLPAMSWTYGYGAPNNSWAESCPNDSCAATKTVEAHGPGAYYRYTFGNRFMATDGMLLKVETGSNPSAILKTETTAYEMDPTGQLYLPQLGWNPYGRSDGSAENIRPVVRRQTLLQGRSFDWRVSTDCMSNGQTAYCFDQLARPIKVVKTSTPAP